MSSRRLTAGMAALMLGFCFPVLAQNAESPAVTDVATLPAASAMAQATSAVVQAASVVADTFHGIVSYYGREFSGRTTASGERYDPRVLTMAHKTLAFGTKVRVTNLRNNRSVVVRVNDRGPFVGSRVGDLSAGAARLLGMLSAGLAHARLEVLAPAQEHAESDGAVAGLPQERGRP